MFELNASEFDSLRSQIVTSSKEGTRYLPMAFTEQGVAMLSSVLNSKQAIAVNIRIIRLYKKIREVLATDSDVLEKLEHLESKKNKKEEDKHLIFEALKQL
jgi:hypothetical protein